MLTEKKKTPPMLARLKKRKLKKEDILKYGTKNEVIFLLETWRGKLQGEYNDFEEFKRYDEIYGLAKRLGFNSAEEAWKANPLVQGGVNPEDYKKVDKVVKDFHRSDKCDRCGKKISQREYKKNGSLCDMCEEDIALGRDKEDNELYLNNDRGMGHQSQNELGGYGDRGMGNPEIE